MSLENRVANLPVKGQMAQQRNVNQRMVADLPANVQLQAIQQILSGQRSFGQEVDTFVKQAAASGMSPDQIRLAFIEEQRQSEDPFVVV